MDSVLLWPFSHEVVTPAGIAATNADIADKARLELSALQTLRKLSLALSPMYITLRYIESQSHAQ
jgi:hypothetical protein